MPMDLQPLLFKALKEEKALAEKKFYQMAELYNKTLERDLVVKLPESYIDYIKNEKDLAYMMFKLKAKECFELESLYTDTQVERWLQLANNNETQQIG